MEPPKPKTAKVYFMAMAAFWLVFGLIATFSPSLMNMFQTENGIKSATTYSNHIWLHDGIDILSISVLLFAISRERSSRNLLRASAIVALLVTFVIIYAILSTSYWNLLFLVPGICCFVFAIWGFRLAGRFR